VNLFDGRPGYFQSLDTLLEHERNLSPDERRLRDERIRTNTRQAMLEADQQRRIDEARRISEISPRFQESALEYFYSPPGNPQALTMARDVVDGLVANVPGLRGFWLYGSTGLGKTHLCSGTLLAAADRGIAGTYRTASGVIDAILATYGHDGRIKNGESDIIGKLARVPLLVLDDLDKVNFSAWVSEKFYKLINARYAENRPLLATSNCGPAQLAISWSEKGLNQSMSVAIIDRLREMCQILELTGRSYRMRA
jgi:DNA replication protein DnaC